MESHDIHMRGRGVKSQHAVRNAAHIASTTLGWCASSSRVRLAIVRVRLRCRRDSGTRSGRVVDFRFVAVSVPGDRIDVPQCAADVVATPGRLRAVAATTAA